MSAPPSQNAVAQLLDRVSGAAQQLAAYLPEGVRIETFMALARRAITENPRLADCTSGSVLRALSRCATSGLPLDGSMSSLVVRRSKNGPPTATWDPTYRGMVSLALASRQVLEVQSFAVTEHDEFSVEHGTEPKIVHKPSVLRTGKIVAAYAWARLRGGGLIVEFLTREDLDQIRKSSPSGDKGPWRGWFGEMAKKSAIRRLLKRLPAAPMRVLDHEADELAALGPDPRLDVPYHRPSIDRSRLTPEAEHAMECAALEAIADAGDVDSLEGAWTKITLEYSRQRLDVPDEVRERYCKRQAAFASAVGREPSSEDRTWLDEYDEQGT